MQSYNDQEKIQAMFAGEPSRVMRRVQRELKKPDVSKVIVGNIPPAGSDVTINGLVYVVKFISRGGRKMHLELKGGQKQAHSLADTGNA